VSFNESLETFGAHRVPNPIFSILFWGERQPQIYYLRT